MNLLSWLFNLKTINMKKLTLTLVLLLITALNFAQEQEKKEAPWNVMYPWRKCSYRFSAYV